MPQYNRTLAVNEDLHKKLKNQAKKEGRLLQRMVEEMLAQCLKNRGKVPA
jgi:predicted HicB family RNase H-like nuclease